MRAQFQHLKPNSLPQRAVPRSAVASTTSISPALKLIAFVLFFPEELDFSIFQFRLTAIRLVLFSLTPVLLLLFGKLLASRKRRLVVSDILVALTGVWMIVSPAVLVDLEYSLQHSAAFAAEFCGSYFAARILLSERGQALSFINLMCHVIAIVALLGILDTLFGKPVIHDWLRGLLGLPPVVTGGGYNEDRLGMLRAMGIIDHPILYGLDCAIGLLLAVASPIRAKGLTIAACGLGVFLSLSSGPIQGAILGLCLLAYDRMFARFRSRWLLLIGIGTLGIGALYALGTSPMDFFFSHYSLNSQSYWIRLWQWRNTGDVVLNSPWFGTPLFQWEEMVKRVPYMTLMWSVDSLWLYLALLYGIPGAALVGLSMVSAVCYPRSGRGVNLTKEESKLAVALSVSIAVLVLVGFTVDLWNSSWILAGLLVGVRAHLADIVGLRQAGPRRTMQASGIARHLAPVGQPTDLPQTR